MQTNVTAWLDATAARCPQKDAVIDTDGTAVTFAAFKAGALSVARALIDVRIGPRQPVAVYLPKCALVLEAFLGIAYAGCFYSPIDPDMPSARAEKIFDVLEPSAVISDRAHADTCRMLCGGARVIVIDDITRRDDDETAVRPIADRIIDADLLYVLFTSGSTGTPKGVCISHRAVIDYIDQVVDIFGITAEDSFANQAPFYFDNSILDIYSMCKTGAELQIVPHDLFIQPYMLLEYLQRHRTSTIFWVPSALVIVSRLQALGHVDLTPSLRRILFAGEVMPVKHLNAWRRHLPTALFANLYGPTEITDACTYYIADRDFDDADVLPIGRAMPNTEVIVLDEHDQLITISEPDRTGELCVRGTCLSCGYYRDRAKTDMAFVQDPLNRNYPEKIYRTGDIVRYNERGELIYVGRRDFQIKHMGHRIELGEIETAVSSLPDMGACCCSYDGKRGRIVLFVEGDHKLKDVKSALSSMLPKYMMPGHLICMEHLPMNANGKIDRAALRTYLA